MHNVLIVACQRIHSCSCSDTYLPEQFKLMQRMQKQSRKVLQACGQAGCPKGS